MKWIATASALLGCSSHAFTSVETGMIRSDVALKGTLRPDSSDAIQEALKMSKEYGANSAEARVAWETVEEMDSSYTPLSSVSAMETSALHDYHQQVSSLARLLHDSQETLDQIQNLAQNIQQLELQDPSLTKLRPQASRLKHVLQEAKAAAELHGSNSVEANHAWEAVEDCVDSVNGMEECSVESMYRYNAAALKAHHYYDAVVDSEFLQEAMDAVDTLSRLRRFVQVENNRLGNDGLTP